MPRSSTLLERSSRGAVAVAEPPIVEEEAEVDIAMAMLVVPATGEAVEAHSPATPRPTMILEEVMVPEERGVEEVPRRTRGCLCCPQYIFAVYLFAINFGFEALF